jgi:hypothetical protein
MRIDAEKQTVRDITEEGFCAHCGWLMEVGSTVYMRPNGDTYCSRTCAHLGLLESEGKAQYVVVRFP